MGALTTALFVTYMLVAPATGWLGDRFPASRSLSPARFCGAWPRWPPPGSTTTGPCTSGTRWSGVGEATFGIFAPAVLADFYPERERNRILSIFYTAIPVGAALGYVAGGQSDRSGDGAGRSSFAPFPGLLIAALYGWIGREPVRGSSDHFRATRDRATFRGLFPIPRS